MIFIYVAVSFLFLFPRIGVQVEWNLKIDGCDSQTINFRCVAQLAKLPKRPDSLSEPQQSSVSFQPMLDISDEEFELESVRKRNLSSVWAADPGIHNGTQEKFSVKTRSIFKEFRKKSSKLIMPVPNSSVTTAFFVNEIVPGSVLKSKSDFNDFGTEFKVGNKHRKSFEDSPDSFYKSMQMVVFLAQFFGVFPVSGIRGPNYTCITFEWTHYKTLYWGLTFLGTVFCFACSAMGGLDNGAFQAASGIFYFACGVLSSLLMLNLGRNWKKLNEEFAKVELKFKKYGFPKNIGFKFKIFTVVVLVGALGKNRLVKQVFEIYSYSFWKGALVLTSHFLTTANWNFKDIFLCTISWTIAERFKQVRDLLDKVHGEDKPISFWKDVREDFNELSVLTKRVDGYIRKLMFLSIGNNLFFICIQLFHSLKEKIDSFKLIYFFWSFGFLVLRTAFVAFSAARINDESKEPKTVLYSVPQKNYTTEVRRFLMQLTTNEVALTGSGFFSITRSLILTITGSVITYEIVLVQFGSSEIQNEFSSNHTRCFHK